MLVSRRTFMTANDHSDPTCTAASSVVISSHLRRRVLLHVLRVIGYQKKSCRSPVPNAAPIASVGEAALLDWQTGDRDFPATLLDDVTGELLADRPLRLALSSCHDGWCNGGRGAAARGPGGSSRHAKGGGGGSCSLNVTTFAAMQAIGEAECAELCQRLEAYADDAMGPSSSTAMAKGAPGWCSLSTDAPRFRVQETPSATARIAATTDSHNRQEDSDHHRSDPETIVAVNLSATFAAIGETEARPCLLWAVGHRSIPVLLSPPPPTRRKERRAAVVDQSFGGIFPSNHFSPMQDHLQNAVREAVLRFVTATPLACDALASCFAWTLKTAGAADDSHLDEAASPAAGGTQLRTTRDEENARWWDAVLEKVRRCRIGWSTLAPPPPTTTCGGGLDSPSSGHLCGDVASSLSSDFLSVHRYVMARLRSVWTDLLRREGRRLEQERLVQRQRDAASALQKRIAWERQLLRHKHGEVDFIVRLESVKRQAILSACHSSLNSDVLMSASGRAIYSTLMARALDEEAPASSTVATLAASSSSRSHRPALYERLGHWMVPYGEEHDRFIKVLLSNAATATTGALSSTQHHFPRSNAPLSCNDGGVAFMARSGDGAANSEEDALRLRQRTMIASSDAGTATRLSPVPPPSGLADETPDAAVQAVLSSAEPLGSWDDLGNTTSPRQPLAPPQRVTPASRPPSGARHPAAPSTRPSPKALIGCSTTARPPSAPALPLTLRVGIPPRPSPAHSTPDASVATPRLEPPSPVTTSRPFAVCPSAPTSGMDGGVVPAPASNLVVTEVLDGEVSQIEIHAKTSLSAGAFSLELQDAMPETTTSELMAAAKRTWPACNASIGAMLLLSLRRITTPPVSTLPHSTVGVPAVASRRATAAVPCLVSFQRPAATDNARNRPTSIVSPSSASHRRRAVDRPPPSTGETAPCDPSVETHQSTTAAATTEVAAPVVSPADGGDFINANGSNQSGPHNETPPPVEVHGSADGPPEVAQQSAPRFDKAATEAAVVRLHAAPQFAERHRQSDLVVGSAPHSSARVSPRKGPVDGLVTPIPPGMMQGRNLCAASSRRRQNGVGTVTPHVVPSAAPPRQAAPAAPSSSLHAASPAAVSMPAALARRLEGAAAHAAVAGVAAMATAKEQLASRIASSSSETTPSGTSPGAPLTRSLSFSRPANSSAALVQQVDLLKTSASLSQCALSRDGSSSRKYQGLRQGGDLTASPALGDARRRPSSFSAAKQRASLPPAGVAASPPSTAGDAMARRYDAYGRRLLLDEDGATAVERLTAHMLAEEAARRVSWPPMVSSELIRAYNTDMLVRFEAEATSHGSRQRPTFRYTSEDKEAFLPTHTNDWSLKSVSLPHPPGSSGSRSARPRTKVSDRANVHPQQ